jgi:2-phosphosulfolactate phosphatase
MNRSIRVHLAPALIDPQDLAGRTVLVIDLLRATTTISYALAAGAKEVVPYVKVEEVRRAAEEARQCGEAVICGGERGGCRIEGFNLGNSPREYTPEVVAGRRVLFTTTNGTRALDHARRSDRILVACLANLSAIEKVVIDAAAIDILCAGGAGSVIREDVVAAGAFVARLARAGSTVLNDSALVALDSWRAASRGLAFENPQLTSTLAASLAEGEHGRHVISLGYEDDLALCAAVDSLDVAGEFDPRGRSVTALRGRVR